MANLNATANVTGITEFKKAFTDLGKEVSSSKNQINLAKEKIQAFGATESNTKSLTEAYNKAIDAQSKRVELCKKNVEKLTDEHGANSAEVRKATDQLTKEETALTRLQGGAVKAANGTKQVAEETGTLGREAKNSENSVSRLKDALVVAGGQLIASAIQGVARAIANIAKESVNATLAAAAWADEILTLSTTTGIATDTLQELTYASKFVDFEMTSVEKGLGKLTKGMQKAQKAGNDYITIADGLTVSLKNEDGSLISAEQAFFNTIDALGTLENETERNIAMQEIFGESYSGLIPLVEGGAESIEKYSSKARELGVILDEETISKLGSLQDTIDNTKSVLDSMKEKAIADVAPAIEDMVNDLMSLLTGDVSISGFFENILDGADKVDTGKIASSVDTFISNVTEFFENAPAMIEAGTSIILGICDGLNGNAESNGSKLGEAIGNTITALSKSFETLSEPVTELAIAFTSQFATAVITHAPEIIFNVIKGLFKTGAKLIDEIGGEMDINERVAAAMVANGETVPESVAQGIADKKSNVTEEMQDMLKPIEENLVKTAETAQASGEQISIGIGAGIRAEAQAAFEAADYLAAGVMSRLAFSGETQSAINSVGGGSVDAIRNNRAISALTGTTVNLNIADPSPAYTDYIFDKFNVNLVR